MKKCGSKWLMQEIKKGWKIMERVKIDWYSMKELAVKKIDEMNRLFKGTNLKAKLFTKTVGQGLLQCEEYAIVVYKEKNWCANTSAKI